MNYRYTSNAYKLISDYYGDKTTRRSGVRLMNHIDEGLIILHRLNASNIVMDAYCLHPILQSDEAFNQNKSIVFSGISYEAVILAMEYRRTANSYLSFDKIEDFVGFSCLEMKQLLYADKVQNEKDFRQYHEGKHERSKELREYFDNWLVRLLPIEL